MIATPPARRRFKLVSKGAAVRLVILFVTIACVLGFVGYGAVVMPGTRHRGPLPELTASQHERSARLERHVRTLASELGQRSIWNPRKLAECALYLKGELAALGYEVREHSYVTRGTTCPNFEVILPGTALPRDVVVVGAHYDSFQGTPGADDNASGVAGVLELARSFAGKPQARTLRFVLFVNEEPPAFQNADMGSWVYAKACRAAGDRIVAMVSLETIGVFSEAPGSQKYPMGLGAVYGDTADFIALVGHFAERGQLKRCVKTFRDRAAFPCEGAALWDYIPGAGWSDHWAFWQEGYPGIMVTDTAPFRNPRYHSPEDTADTLDYDKMARVVSGVEAVVKDLASSAAE